MDTIESSQNTKDQEIPGVFAYRLRDREQLRKRKLEAQEQKSSQWVFKEKSKTKRRKKAKASGTSSKLPKEPEPVPELEPKPEPEAEPVLEPVPLQEEEEEEEEEATDKVAEWSLEREKPAPLQESVNFSTTGDLAATLTDGLGENTCVKIPEILPLQREDVPGENPPFEEQIVLSM